MLRNAAQYRSARIEVYRLESLAKSGQATDTDHQRLSEGRLELLCWEWERESGKPAASIARPSIPERDPRAIRFLDWWERNRGRYPEAYWMDGFNYWIEPMDLTSAEAYALYTDAAEEYHEREWHRRQAERTERAVA